MAGETSSPGGQDTIDQAEEENMMAEMTDAQSQAQMSEAGLSMGFGDFAGSTALSNQMNSSITGSNVADALVPGIGTLSLISSLSAKNMQDNLQRGASPVYGPGGTVQGTTSRGLFGGTVYSGNPDLDPNRTEPDDNNDGGNVGRRTLAGRPGAAVKGVSNTTSARITPSSAVRGSGASLAPKLYAMSSRGKGRGVNTSPQGILGSAPVKRKVLLGS
tara:strand:+ start:837 stop:1487 length:651 start_codon:yes stop_codon:yes gene_type:complete